MNPIGTMARAIGLAALAALTGLVPALAADPIRGEALYRTYCLDCHGSLQAVTNSTVLNARSLAPVLREGFANPRSGMGFLADILSTADIDSIVAYLGTDPIRLDFGEQALGGATVARRVTIQAGREDLTGLRPAVQGDFSLAATSCGERLAAEGRCTVDVRFEPQGAGPRTGLLSVTHSGVTTPVRINLDGQGRADLPRPAALLTLDLRAIDFGSVTTGQASAETVVTLGNSGNADLAILSAIAPVGFALRNDCTSPVRPGGSCRLGLVFQPAAIGAVAGELVLTSNQPGGTVRVPLTGTGSREAARLSWSVGGGRVEFAPTPIGRSGAVSPLQLVNQGPGPATLEALSVAGNDAGDFVIDSSSTCRTAVTLPAGGQCTIALVFTPRAVGDRSARLTVQAAAQLPAALVLAGVGAPVAVSSAPTNVGAGGCTLGGGHPAFDPVWPLLTVAALAVLGWRRWQRRMAERHARDHGHRT